MSTKSAEEVLEDYKISMGDDLGTLMYFFWNELNTMWIILSDFKTLYSSKKSYVDLLNKSAPRFFWEYQKMWWQYMTIGILRLTEQNKRKKKERASMVHLVELITDNELKEQCKKEYEELVEVTKDLKIARHNLYAHYNYNAKIISPATTVEDVSIKAIKQALLQLGKIFNLVLDKYQNATVPWEMVDDDLGANQILCSLAMGETFEPLHYKYQLRKPISDDDFDWRKWLEEKPD